MTADTIQKIADDLEGFILLSDQQRKTLVDRLRALSARASAGEGGEAEWITSLRNEAMQAAMKDVFWLSRDQVFELIGGPLTTAPQPAQAGAIGGVWAPTCQKCRMTITRPGECAIGGQHCQCPATPASPATGEEGLEQIGGLEFYLHEDPDAEDEIEPVRLVMAMSVGNKVYCHRITQGNNGICCDATPPAHGDGEGDDPFGDMPAPIGNPEVWPPNYADGYNDAVRNMVDSFPSVRARLTTRPTPEAQEARDAARWRALIGSARIRVLGSAGLLTDTRPDGGPWNGYAHIGLELWTKHEAGNEPTDAVEWLTKYTDTALALPAQGEGSC